MMESAYIHSTDRVNTLFGVLIVLVLEISEPMIRLLGDFPEQYKVRMFTANLWWMKVSVKVAGTKV